jgi:site-specific recombinase XerD
MRRSEQYNLRWEDVNFKTSLVTIPRSKHGERRFVQLNSGARNALNVLLQSRDASGLVCCLGSSRDRERGIWFKEVMLKAKVENFRWHDLRHTFASRLVMAGVDLPSVMKLMGHRNIQTTMRYAHLAPKHLAEAAERMIRPTDTAPDTKHDRASRESHANAA